MAFGLRAPGKALGAAAPAKASEKCGTQSGAKPSLRKAVRAMPSASNSKWMCASVTSRAKASKGGEAKSRATLGSTATSPMLSPRVLPSKIIGMTTRTPAALARCKAAAKVASPETVSAAAAPTSGSLNTKSRAMPLGCALVNLSSKVACTARFHGQRPRAPMLASSIAMMTILPGAARPFKPTAAS